MAFLNQLNHQKPAFLPKFTLFCPLFLPWGNLREPFCTASFSPIETLPLKGVDRGKRRCGITSPYHFLPTPISGMEKNEINVPSQMISCISNEMFLVKKRKKKKTSGIYFIKTWAQFQIKIMNHLKFYSHKNLPYPRRFSLVINALFPGSFLYYFYISFGNDSKFWDLNIGNLFWHFYFKSVHTREWIIRT